MTIDIITVIVVAFGFYLGYQRGLIKTVFDTLSLLIGVLAALKLSPWTMDAIEATFHTHKSITLILGIAFTFLGVMILIRFVGKKLEDLLEVVNVNFVNKMAGGSVQAIFFAILLSYLVGFADKLTLIKAETKENSTTFTHLMQMPAVSQKLFQGLKPVFSRFWEKTTEAVNSLKKPEESPK
ncbi:MAG TPA: CvpA family protein [Saprospiraceae bacterium]|nr:CvpA family protein [Saprospiraceae bacterium]HRG19567.1 CvpA family protein [Saprospiraceae bacterium]